MTSGLPKITFISSENGPLDNFVVFAHALKEKYRVTILSANKSLSTEIQNKYAEVVKEIQYFSIEVGKHRNKAQYLIECCQQEAAIVTGVGEKFDQLLQVMRRTFAHRTAGIAFYHQFKPVVSPWSTIAAETMLVSQAVLFANKNLKLEETQIQDEELKNLQARLYRIGFHPEHENKMAIESSEKARTLQKTSNGVRIGEIRSREYTSLKEEFILIRNLSGKSQIWVCEGDNKAKQATYLSFLEKIIQIQKAIKQNISSHYLKKQR